SRTITHKSDIGGVAVGVPASEVEARIDEMRERVRAMTGSPPSAWLVQEQVRDGMEMIVGLIADPLGTGVLLGMGGTTAELLDDTALRMIDPARGLTAPEALAMVRQLRAWPLLDGYRGRRRHDVGALVQAIVAFSRLAAALGDRLVTAEINPLFVLPAGQGVRAADGVMLLR
ncbi:MAG: acetate--CoA ligase family protein, partial [Lautropia sp.]